MSGNIKTAQRVAEDNQRLWNNLREELTFAAADERARLKAKMENVARDRDAAIAEIKAALQSLLEQDITIQSPKANPPA